jgi:alpha-D-xyloside xylohydrolase
MPMSKVYKSILFSFVLYTVASAGFVEAMTRNQEIVRLRGSILRVEIVSPTIIRVSATPGQGFSDRDTLSVVRQDETAKWRRRVTRGTVTISTDSLIVEINRRNGSITFLDLRKKVLLKAVGLAPDNFTKTVLENDSILSVRQNFTLTRSEAIYGLGQFEDAIMNYRGHDVLLAQANRTAVNPFLVSTNGYGILWNNYSESRFHDGADGTYFWSQVADQVDYYFVYGPTIDGEIRGYRSLTGEAPMFGKWAYGYWQCKERYKTAEELIDVVKEYRARQIPLDNIVQDWQYWGDMDEFSGMVWDSTRYPHPALTIDTLHDLHSHLMVSIWPAFGRGSAIYKEMAERDFLFSTAHWCGGRVYDAWNPVARDLYWKFVRKGLFDAGVDAFWMDGTEPEFRCTDDRYITALSLESAGRNYLGSNASYLNTFSLETTRGIYDHQRATSPAKRVFILTRSAFSGQQRFAAATWSGDTFASWDALKTQVASGVNFCMSGLPYWTNDIGGFITAFNYPGGVKDDAYKELYVRWFEFGAFNPIFRSHGTNTPREVWQFGDKGSWAYDALVKFDDLRYRLMPYIYSLAWMTTSDGYTIMRGLPMDFPKDKNTFAINTQFMFGPSIMVCPVLKPMYHTDAYKGFDITPDHFYSADGTDHGLRLDIYRGTGFDSLVLSRRFEASQISWIGCLPEGLDSSYSLKINGKIKTEGRGKYIFYLFSDAGVKLWINDKLLVDEWDNKATAKFETAISLEGHKKYSFRMEYRQFKPNTAGLKINWIPPRKDNHPMKINVYLPRKTGSGNPFKWFDFWTGKTLAGGEDLHVKTPIDMIPLFVPAGSIIPMGPVIQYTAQDPAAPLEVRIYPGRDGSFKLYEDQNDNYDYEHGMHSVISFKWNQKMKVLTVGNRMGEFPGMVGNRVFNIVLVKPGHGSGAGVTPIPDRVVHYDGRQISVKF